MPRSTRALETFSSILGSKNKICRKEISVFSLRQLTKILPNRGQYWQNIHRRAIILKAAIHAPRMKRIIVIQWILNFTNNEGTEEMCSIYRGFVKSKTSIARICMKIIKMFVISKCNTNFLIGISKRKG